MTSYRSSIKPKSLNRLQTNNGFNQGCAENSTNQLKLSKTIVFKTIVFETIIFKEPMHFYPDRTKSLGSTHLSSTTKKMAQQVTTTWFKLGYRAVDQCLDAFEDKYG